MTLDSCSLPPQIWPWLQRNFRRFRVLKHVETTLIGGLGFHRPPKSLKHLQTLLSKNLKNWGYDRASQYDRGWLRFCAAAEFKSAFLPEEIQKIGRALQQISWTRLPCERRRGSASDVESLRLV